MGPVTYDRGKLMCYLAWVFGIAWAMQVGVALLYGADLAFVGQLLMALMMFVPALAVRLAGGSFFGMGLRPRLRGIVGIMLIAWFLPAVLTAIGALLYFLVFPDHLDLTGSFLVATVGEGALAELEAKGMAYPTYIIVCCVSAISYAPAVNGLVAVGEEIGWRGFLYPQLKARLGEAKGLLLGGAVWGAWHWPLIWLIGFEYGLGYVGYPVSGMLLFCVLTIAIGCVCDALLERAGTIWAPAIFHGALNAAANIPLLVCVSKDPTMRLLGPGPIGVIAGLPMVAAAILVIVGRKAWGRLGRRYCGTDT